MKRKHFLTSLKKLWSLTKQPGSNIVQTTTAPQTGGNMDMNKVYRNERTVSTASQAETQLPTCVDGTAAGDAIANLRQALGNMKQAMDGLNAAIAEMYEAADKNQGKIPDVNRIVEEVLAQSRKGKDET